MAAGRIRRGMFIAIRAIWAGMEHHRQLVRTPRTRWEAVTEWLGGFKPLELILFMVSGITLVAALHAMWSA